MLSLKNGIFSHSSLELNICRPHMFWNAASLPQLLYFKSNLAGKNSQGNFDLNCISGRKSILRLEGVEYVVIQRRENSVQFAGTGCSLISGPCRIKFEIEGLEGVAPQLNAIKKLARFAQNNDENSDIEEQSNSLLLLYLIALDGFLAGKTYRQIAQVLYGEDRVSEVWSSETRFMKDKVRRAVERGIA